MCAAPRDTELFCSSYICFSLLFALYVLLLYLLLGWAVGRGVGLGMVEDGVWGRMDWSLVSGRLVYCLPQNGTLREVGGEGREVSSWAGVIWFGLCSAADSALVLLASWTWL